MFLTPPSRDDDFRTSYTTREWPLNVFRVFCPPLSLSLGGLGSLQRVREPRRRSAAAHRQQLHAGSGITLECDVTTYSETLLSIVPSDVGSPTR